MSEPWDDINEKVKSDCIDVTEVSLVTRAVHTMWRAAYEDDDIEQLNSASNPL